MSFNVKNIGIKDFILNNQKANKMIKYYISIAILLFFTTVCISLCAQEKELYVTYNYKFNSRSLLRHERSVKDGVEVEVFSYKNQIIHRRLDFLAPISDENHNILGFDTIYAYVVKDYERNHLLTSIPRGLEYFLTKEPLNLFEWKLDHETKNVLGYSCHKALCSFRGRDYVAYFTKDIPFTAAPWKFHGLPGVVLEVYSTDGVCAWDANTLEIRPLMIENFDVPIDGYETINQNQYLKFRQDLKQKNQEGLRKLYMNNSEVVDKPDPSESELFKSIEIFDLGD